MWVLKTTLHGVLMKVIPWRCWGWNVTRVLMKINYWANKEEFIELARYGRE